MKHMRRTERNKTTVIKPEDLQSVTAEKQVKTQEEIMQENLKAFIQIKLSISEEFAEEVVKKIFDLIDTVEQESCIKNNCDTARESSDRKIEDAPCTTEKEPEVSITSTLCCQDKQKPAIISENKIPSEIINSTIRVKDLSYSFENVVDGIIATTDRNNETNAIKIYKSEIINERTFNFQNLLKMFGA